MDRQLAAHVSGHYFFYAHCKRVWGKWKEIFSTVLKFKVSSRRTSSL